MALLKETLVQLSELHAPTGHEEEVADFLESKFKNLGWEVRRDTLGNVIAKKGKGGKKILVAAHMDEIALAVTAITEKGFLKFTKVGGIFDGAVGNTRVVVHADKKISGLIGLKAPHLMKDEEAKKLVEHEQLCIDIGAKDKKEAEKMGIRPGTPVSFEASVVEIGDGLLAGKSFDDRVGCAILLKLAEELKNPQNEVYLAGTVREETGLYGAGVTAFGIEPDLAIAVDATTSNAADVTEDQVPVKIDGGPALAVIEGSGQGLIMSKKLVDWIAFLAKQNKLSLQYEVAEKGGSDASRMQYIKTGLLVASIGIPCRYTHSTNELISVKDVEDSGKLVKAMIEGFKEYK